MLRRAVPPSRGSLGGDLASLLGRELRGPTMEAASLFRSAGRCVLERSGIDTGEHISRHDVKLGRIQTDPLPKKEWLPIQKHARAGWYSHDQPKCRSGDLRGANVGAPSWATLSAPNCGQPRSNGGQGRCLPMPRGSDPPGANGTSTSTPLTRWYITTADPILGTDS